MSPILRILLALVISTVAASAQPGRSSEPEGISHGYDLLHVAIDVRFDLPKKLVIGSVQHRMRLLGGASGAVRMHAAENMGFRSVTVEGAPARYKHTGDTLIVYVPSSRMDDTITVGIEYTVAPTRGMYFIQPDSLMPMKRNQIWTQGEEDDNHFWVPIYDHPDDRTTTEIRATVPAEWKALSNGRLISSGPGTTPGTSVWHYRMEKPHSTYLIMLAAGEFMVTHDTVDGIPLEYWTYPEMPERVMPTFSRTPDAIRYLSTLLGVPYPWNKYSQITIADFMFGGMENTTATTLNDYVLVDERGLLDYNPDGVIAHEAAHMWYGDLVSNRDWGHLWLHESYATYLAARYRGYRYGEDVFLEEMYDNGAMGIQSQGVRGRNPLALGDNVTANIYQRGSRVLHMLNRIVGEEAFWRANRIFLERHSYGLVQTDDLKAAFNEATGRDLGWFFDEWIYKAGHPEYRVDKNWSKGTLSLRVRQAQNRDSMTGLFRMPVPLEFHLRGGIVRDTIQVEKEDETFTFQLGEEPDYVIFDAGDAILKTVEFPRSTDELVAQLMAARSIDRMLAVEELASAERTLKGPRGDQKRRSLALFELLEREPVPFVREAIINKSSMLDSLVMIDVIGRGLRDTSVEVRSAAVENSYLVASKSERARLLRPLLGDSSYAVVASVLGMLAVTDTSGLEPTLRGMKGMRGRRDRLALEWLGAVLSGGYNSLADDVSDYTLPLYNSDTRIQAYYVLGKLDTTTGKVRDAIIRGLRESSRIIRSTAASAARSHLDAEMRSMLRRLRTELTGAQRSTVDGILDE